MAVKGDEVYAEGTSLGGDDGIAVAYSLALLDSRTIRHPRLEVVITVDEEVGMDGARAIDLSMLTGSRMINLDSEDEGIFLTSCAGGARVKCRQPLEVEQGGGAAFRVTVGGLLGGHSGGEIHKERGNSNCLFGRLLKRLSRQLPVRLCEVKGGLADNAIPRETTGIILVEEKDRAAFTELLSEVEREIRAELATKDPGFYIRAEAVEGEACLPDAARAGGTRNGIAAEAGNGLDEGASGMGDCQNGSASLEKAYSCVSAADTVRAADFLTALPNGVQAMSADMPGLVETSLNLGILELDVKKASALREASGKGSAAPGRTAVSGTAPGLCQVKEAVSGPEPENCQVKEAVSGPEPELCQVKGSDSGTGRRKAVLLAEFSVRSSLESAKHALIDKLHAVTGLAGGGNEVTGDYPGWAYRKDSPLRDKMVALYERMYGVKPKVEAIHAGLECGILGSKIRDLDCVSMGPQMTAIHTTEETLSISSTRRVWEYLVALLEEKDA